MPRIRTLKPEFFRSPSTAKCSFGARILYEALWCWADDFGIGETNIHGWLGFAFPDSDEISAHILRGFCAEIAQHFEITFYIVRGRHYYAIENWDEHQKTERRTERRKNPTPEDPEAVSDLQFQDCAESAAQCAGKPAQNPRKNVAGTGEQGNRGTGNPPYPPNDENAPPAQPAKQTGVELARTRFEAIPACPSPLARHVATAYNRALPVPLEARVLGEVAAEIDRCLRSQIPPDAIAAGIELWTHSDSWAPSQIPRFVAKANNRINGAHTGKPTEKALGYDEAANQLIATLEGQP